ncbi:aminoglycoside phosphotransferase family protein [Solirubrobacter soli]|uniref:aminoglycoside phosphotransferase family protein n=1 Tax=Solirubrobacter soli TaxID=363832 RepID=UPI000428A736|nr:aminoglycoside phosphotransferase family protein [Solirubrobacter soli]
MIFDPAVPRRDELLRGDPVYVKYRVGESLRVVHRHADEWVAARTDGSGDIAHFPFPHDRKLDLAAIDRLLDETTTPRLVAWAAEQSATFECRDPSGRVVAYARVQRDAAPWPALDTVRTPHVLASTKDALLLEPLAGVRLDNLNPPRPPLGSRPAFAPYDALVALGEALRNLNGSRPALDSVPRFARLDPGRLVTAAEVIGRVRPDAADAANRLLERLLAHVPACEPVLIHGDANLRNAVLQPDGTVALLDLEDLSVGPAAADLGQLIAGGVPPEPLLRGYGDPPEALRWHTAASILARVALPAISRYRPQLLKRLPQLLDA